MSGITFPMKNLGPQELGVANWLFYDNSVLMTYGCRDNRQWFVGIKVRDHETDHNSFCSDDS